MPTMAQRQRAAIAAAAASTSSITPQQAKTAAQRQQVFSQKNPSYISSSNGSPNNHQKQHQINNNNSKESESEETAFSDEDSDEDEAAAAFEMDGQELWTLNYCATCDCLIEPGQGVGVKKKKEESPILISSRNSLPATALKSKSGTIKARPTSSEGAPPNNMKRTHSAGKLHAVGGAGVLGPHKRTGSAAGRLNALSELRPTTKLNGETNNKSKAQVESDQGKKSPSLSRRNSTVSERSGGNSANSSRPASPVSPTQGLSRLKKSRAHTITITPNDEDLDGTKVKSAPALYCSERCQRIDEQRSSGLGELVYYLHQPASPPSTWNVTSTNNNNNNNMGYNNSWFSRNLTLGNQGRNSPGSECNCPECMDKNSASGTVPSGASDTTESSASYQYAPSGRKQRTQSGRIMTPQNLVAPGGHGNDYFSYVVGPNGQRKSISKGSQRSTLAMETASQEGSTISSESAVSEMWEPNVKPTRQSTMRSPKSSRDSGTNGTATTGTVTPAATINSPRRPESPSVWNLNSHNLSASQASTSSPLRLIRKGDLHSHPSVDVTADFAQSPQAYPSSFLSRSMASMASEQTEGAASSGLTLAGVNHPSPTSSLSASLLERKCEGSDGSRMTPLRMTNSPMPIDSQSAIGTLKNAQNRALSEEANNLEERRQSTSSSTGGSSGWLRNSISTAWNSIRGLPPSASYSSDAESGQLQDQTHHYSAGSGTLSRFSSALSGLSALAVADNDPTPKQSQIARPKTTRGDIPAFASEIGHGSIPGEEYSRQGARAANLHEEHLSKSLASAHGSMDDERRRRRSEKERAQRHQRSKDITVLPPLLGVSRTASSANLNTTSKTTRPSHVHHASSASLTGVTNRSRTGSYGQSLHSGSFTTLNGLTRSTTPGLRPNQNNTTPVIELGSSPSRMLSVGSLGTSPRRGSLGWGAMTPIASPDASQLTFNINRPPSHASQRSSHHPHQHHHHHNHHSRHHHHQQQQQGNRSQHRLSGSSGGSNNNLVVLGHVGNLGSHPHGHGPIYGRHATTPVRSSTPRVPEDGGEMSGAALKGEEEQDNDVEQTHDLPKRRSFVAPPSRPHSVMTMRGSNDSKYSYVNRNHSGLLSGSHHQRNQSSEDGKSSVKMYPVLDVPNRQQTHDKYDSLWNVDRVNDNESDQSRQSGKALDRKPVDDSRPNETTTNSSHRKRLFYFDTT